MGKLPILTETYVSQRVIDVFKGYNHNLKIADGEFYDMRNLTSSDYPLLSNRAKRGYVKQLTAPSAMLGKSKLAYIDGATLWYGDKNYSSFLEAKGFRISDTEDMLPKQLISMGAYIIIYPDKLYINTEDPEKDCGSIEARFSTVEGQDVTYTICTADGKDYDSVHTGLEPESPESGTLWLDTSGSVHSLKQYSGSTGVWTDIATVYTKITYAGIGEQFNKFDGVTISGVAWQPETEEAEEAAESEIEKPTIAEQLEALNGSHIIYEKGDDYIVIVGLLDQIYEQNQGTVTVSRTMPDLDYITESENRLWGCKYGLVDGKTVNEIYCCALGDFKNWNQFLGLATDSYVASVGTDGPWTGAVTHLGYPIFFKENCLHKVYISSTGAHQIVDTACRGIQKGSHSSPVVVNERLYYKAVTDVMVYDGSLPVSVSEQMGVERYFEAVGGALGDKYYISMKDRNGGWHLFVYDTLRGLWHREDETQVMEFARCDGELYFIDVGTKQLMSVNGSVGEAESDIEWSAVTGLMGYSTVNRKYISRFNLRMRLPEGSNMKVFVQYDSDGVWRNAGQIKGAGTKTFTLPVRPRRCDHFMIKLEGVGDVKIYSFAKIFESGSDM